MASFEVLLLIAGQKEIANLKEGLLQRVNAPSYAVAEVNDYHIEFRVHSFAIFLHFTSLIKYDSYQAGVCHNDCLQLSASHHVQAHLNH